MYLVLGDDAALLGDDAARVAKSRLYLKDWHSF